MKLLKPFAGDYRITCDYECHLAYSSAPGIDWALPMQTSVLAAAPGTVDRCHWGKRGGRYLRISHGNGIYTLYSHLAAFCVAVGERVKAGQRVAHSDNTGASTGPHLHFAYRERGKWVDPAPHLGMVTAEPAHRTRVGLHGRNDKYWTEDEYEMAWTAKIETFKMMSFTDNMVFERLRCDNPDIEFIVRLYDDRMGKHGHPPAEEFVARMSPIIERLHPYATKFEIHNEPNHVAGIEGWGPTDDDARSFRDWYDMVRFDLKAAHSWAKFGFPGLALNYPHRDMAWLDICRDEILDSDWLGCHTYWQYNNMMSDGWGLRFKHYHGHFPDMPIEITEFGDSTPGLIPSDMASRYVRYYQELNKYPYLRSASAFIASSPDPQWAPFCWMDENGTMKPVVQAVGDMPRG